MAILPAAGAIGLVAFEAARLPDVQDLVGGAHFSTVLLDREGNPIRYQLTTREELSPRVPLSEIHSYLKCATIAAEDERFYSHPGVDVLAMARALWTNIERGCIVSGASTITMQVARLLRPLPRSWYGKFREAVLAVHLEMELTKDEILELYLNLSPYGSNLRGVEGAARRYFGRSANDLSLSEAALLAGLPQSPARLRPDLYPERARARRDWILDRMESLGMIRKELCVEAKAMGVHAGWTALPLVAPHFSSWARRRVSPGERLRTSLDSTLQNLAEEAIRGRLQELGAAEVRNGAVVIAETESGKIRALVGSQDFFESRDGQVNGASSPRSPGSLLKPFIYGFAFEDELAGPDTILHDEPLNFRDGYEPRNFTKNFAGPVTARDALVRSLNVPAVELLSRLGVQTVIDRLRQFGLSSIREDAAHYGLALGLGGVEVTLLELVEAYAALGRLGEHRPLSFREDAEPAPACRVLSPISAYQVADILEGVAWKDARENGVKLPRVALKTGTSFGLRDAWALAYTPSWTVGVWFGNFDARPSESLVGGIAAVPTALSLMRRLEPEGGGSWFPRPEGMENLASSVVSDLKPEHQSGVRWIQPADGAIFVRHGRSGGNELKLRAEIIEEPGSPSSEHSSQPTLSWFVNGDFLGRSRSGELLTWPLQTGRHRITLIDHQGKAEERMVMVER